MSVDPDMLMQALMAQASNKAVGKAYPQVVENDNSGMPNKLSPEDKEWMQFITGVNQVDLDNHKGKAKRIFDEGEDNINAKSKKWDK